MRVTAGSRYENCHVPSGGMAGAHERWRNTAAPWALWALAASALLGAAVTVVPSQGGVAVLGALTVVIAAMLAARPAALTKLSYLTFALMFLDVSPIMVSGSMLRIYQPLSLVLIGALFLPHLPGAPPRRGPLLAWLVAFTGLVLASNAWTISAHDTLVLSFGQPYLLYLFVLVGGLLARKLITVQGVLNALWVGASVCGAVAVAQFFGGLAGISWGLQYVTGVPWGRPSGLMLEPDWMALAAAMGMVIAVVARRPGSYLYRTTMALFVFVLAVTLVRAVIIALAVLFLCALVMRHQGALRRQLYWIVPVTGTAVIFLLALWPQALARLSPSVLMGNNVDNGAYSSRLGVVQLIQDRGPDRPWLGHGAGSLAYESALPANMIRYAGGGDLNAGRGSANLLLTSFWDLGWTGVLLMAAVVLTWLWCAYRVRAQHPALLALAVMLLVDFQANNGIRFGFVWVLMAVTSWAAAQAALKGRAKGQALPVAV